MDNQKWKTFTQVLEEVEAEVERPSPGEFLDVEAEEVSTGEEDDVISSGSDGNLFIASTDSETSEISEKMYQRYLGNHLIRVMDSSEQSGSSSSSSGSSSSGYEHGSFVDDKIIYDSEGEFEKSMQKAKQDLACGKTEIVTRSSSKGTSTGTEVYKRIIPIIDSDSEDDDEKSTNK